MKNSKGVMSQNKGKNNSKIIENNKQRVFIYVISSKQKVASATWRFTLRSETISDNCKPFKNDEKCFLFHMKAPFVLKVSNFLS